MKTEHTPNTVKESNAVQQAVLSQAVHHKLGCAVAFEIAEALNVSPRDVGQTLDQLNYRITFCQLGLFGHEPEKKIVTADKNAGPELRAAIEAAAVKGRLSCKEIWNIAQTLGLPKTAVSNACEGLGVKIKDCQLGAF